MSLQDIKLEGESVTGGGANNICLLDNDGIAYGSYGWWMPEDGTGEAAGCWFDGDNWAPITVEVSSGEGFYIYAQDAGLSVVSAGEVKLTPYSRDLTQGYNLVGNCSPVDLDLQNVKLEGEAVTGGGVNNICLLDNDGIAYGSYGWWMPEDGTGEAAGCWFDGDNWAPIEGTVKAGEGLYLYAADAGLKITLPKAL